MEVEEFKDKLSTDNSYLSYIVRRYLSIGSFDLVATELDLPIEAFDKIFAESPEIEDKFIEVLREVSEKALLYSTTVAVKAATKELVKYFGSIDYDEKASTQACTAILNYHARQYPRVKDGEREEDEIDKLFKRLGQNPKTGKNT